MKDMITVMDFSKKINLSVDIILDLCKKININVNKESDFLLKKDIKLLYESFKDIFTSSDVFFDENYFFGYIGNNNSDYYSSVNNNYQNTYSSSNAQNSGLTSNKESTDLTSNDESTNLTSNEESADLTLTNENVNVVDDNVNIDVVALCKGGLLVDVLKDKIDSLKSSLSGITVIPPVDSSILNSCITNVNANIEDLDNLIKRVNDVEELIPDKEEILLFLLENGDYFDDGELNIDALQKIVTDENISNETSNRINDYLTFRTELTKSINNGDFSQINSDGHQFQDLNAIQAFILASGYNLDMFVDLTSEIELQNQQIKDNDVGSGIAIDNVKNDNFLSNNQWTGTRLTAPMGLNVNGPSGTETWYPLAMGRIVKNMEDLYGYTNLECRIREDGVRLLSGTTPEGEEFKDLVIVAADVRHDSANPNGTFERGQIVTTSLGMGIVADFCERSYNERVAAQRVNDANFVPHFDIATAWWDPKYIRMAYGNKFPIETAEQLLPDQTHVTLRFNAETGEISIDYRDKVEVVETENQNEFDDTVESENDDDLQVDDDAVSSDDMAISGANIKPKNNSDIAHRGNRSAGGSENSVKTFRTAGEKGFWGCEADVRFDSTGNLVCSHNPVSSGSNTPSFEEYLDICKEYGMTAIIDLKYENGPNHDDPNLSPAILQTIEEKGMLDSCVIQTNNPKDIPYIRENSSEARIWYLTDVISESNLKLIEENNVECVNIDYYGDNDYKIDINKLNEQGIDVCVWRVFEEDDKEEVLNLGAKYVMSDNVLGITPYQEGEQDFNGIVS